jgi:hypothetical protein
MGKVLLGSLAAASLLVAPNVRAAAPAAPEPAFDVDSPYVGGIAPQLPNVFRTWEQPGADHKVPLGKQRQAGLSAVYTWLAWSDIERTEGTYRWAELDQFVKDAHDVGILPVLQVQVGAWGYPQHFAPPTRVNSRHPAPGAPPADMDRLRRFWSELVRRYKPGGTLASLEGWATFGVRVWEVENEPDNIPWWGTWDRMPKDYAEYLSVIYPAIKAADPNAIVSAPALSQSDANNPSPVNGRLGGIHWFEEVLSPGSASSEWASDQYRAATTHPSGGPFIDSFSFHRDTAPVHDSTVVDRINLLRQTIGKHSTDPAYPTKADAPLFFSEGGALQYASDGVKHARAQAQLMSILLGNGVSRMLMETGSEPNGDWPNTAMFKAVKAMTTYFPRAGEVVAADGSVDAARAKTFVRTDPATGLRTYITWAKDLLPGTAPGAAFAATVPVRTAQAEVVGADWAPAVTMPAVSGGVSVSLVPDDPSPVVIVREIGPLPAA